MSPFGRNALEGESNYADDLGKMAAKEMTATRQDSAKYPTMDANMFGSTSGNEANPPRHYFSNYRNFDGMQNDSFYQGNLSFKNDMDFGDMNYGRGLGQSFGGNSNANANGNGNGNGNNGNGYQPMEFKFSPSNPPMGQSRQHQNSFNYGFGDQRGTQGYGSDYPTNVMNPNSMQYNSSHLNPNYYHYRRNTFNNHKR